MKFQSPKTISKTTLNLVPGDEISRGNAWDGFWSYTVVSVAPAHNPRMMVVTVRFDHGGTCELVEGKNVHWPVLAAAQASA